MAEAHESFLVDSSGDAVNWKQRTSDFLENPSKYLSDKKISAEVCLDQILRDLNRKFTANDEKLRLLILLQDEVDILLTKDDCVERTVTFLLSYYNQLSSNENQKEFIHEIQLLQSQVLVTLTTVLLTTNKFDAPNVNETCVTVIDELLQIVLNAGNDSNCQLRSVACDCLIELESAYPRLFSSMLDTFKDLFILERSYVFQKYALLFCIACEHYYTEPEDKFSRTEQLMVQILCRQSSVQTLLTSPVLNNVQQKQALSSLMEQLPHITSHMVVPIMQHVAKIIISGKITSPTILKPIVLTFNRTYDVSILHLICNLQMNFGRELFTEVEEQELLAHIFHLAQFPTLSSAQRLLCLDWLNFYVTHTKREDKSHSSMELNSDFAIKFCPTIFDGWETAGKKFFLMSALLRGASNEDETSKMMWECLSCASDVAFISITRRAVVTLLRSLFTFLHDHQWDTFQPQIVDFLTNIIKRHSSFAPNVINFFNCVNENASDNCLPEKLWRSVAEFIVHKAPLDLTNIPNYLMMLKEVAAQPEIIACPQEIIHFLHCLVLTIIEEHSTWLLGNKILLVCHTLLCSQISDKYFRELGDVLFLLSSQYNDVDVQDGARLLYMTLTSLSQEKIKTMFNYQLPSTVRSTSFTSSISDSSSIHNFTKIVSLNQSPIELVKSKSPLKLSSNVEMNESEVEIPKNTLKPYRVFVGANEFKAAVKVPYLLQFKEKFDETFAYDKLFCIEIELVGPESYGEIPNIVISYLTCNEPKSVIIEMYPSECSPVRLYGRATFSTKDAVSYSCLLSPVVSFEDYFLPLAIPPAFSSVQQQWRSRVFEDLWTSFLKSAERGPDSSCVESMHLMKLDEDLVSKRLIKRFQALIVDSDSECLGIFLPSRNHILLRIRREPTATTIHIAADHTKYLAQLNQLLLDLEKDKLF